MIVWYAVVCVYTYGARPQDIFAARLREKIVTLERNLGKAQLKWQGVRWFPKGKPWGNHGETLGNQRKP